MSENNNPSGPSQDSQEVREAGPYQDDLELAAGFLATRGAPHLGQRLRDLAALLSQSPKGAAGTPIEKGLEELHLTGKDVARMRHAVECWDEFHKREDSRPGSSWALAPLEIAEEQFRLLVADARASLSSLPQEGAAGEGGAG